MKKKYFRTWLSIIFFFLFFQKIEFAQKHYLAIHYEPIWTSISNRWGEVEYELPLSFGISYSNQLFTHWGLSIRGGYIFPIQRYFGGLECGGYIKYYWDYGLYILNGINVNNIESFNHPNSAALKNNSEVYFVIGAGYGTGSFEFEAHYLHPLSREFGYLLVNAPTLEESHSPIYFNSMIKVSIAYCIEL
jgi:hypothetical protein